MSMTHQRADATLNAALRGGATPHIWLHTGSPGAAGTANVAQLSAANIVRKAITFTNPPENHPVNIERRVLNTAGVVWSGAEINTGVTITHFSIWSALTLGAPEFIATVALAKTTGSEGVTIATGDIEVAIGVFIRP